MSSYSQRFITFSKQIMLTQGEDIKSWSKSENPILVKTCKEVMEAAGVDLNET